MPSPLRPHRPDPPPCKKDGLLDGISHSLKKVLSQTAIEPEELTLPLSVEPMANRHHVNFKHRLLLLLLL